MYNRNPDRISVTKAELIDQLVSAVCKQASWGSSVEEVEAQAIHNRLFGYAMRIADNWSGASTGGNAEITFQAIKQSLVQENRHEEAARFAELYQQLSTSPGLGGRGPSTVLKPLPVTAVARAPADVNSFIASENSYKRQHADKPVQQQQPAASVAAAGHQRCSGSSAALSMVKQPELVKDALCLVQGLTGRYSSFSSSLPADLAAASCGICVAPQEQLLLPIGMRTLLHELGELGLLYQRVKEAAVQGRQHGSGSVRQALCAALQEEITDFYRLMAVLEAQLAAPMPLPGADGCAAAGVSDKENYAAAAAGDGHASGTYLTLRRLQLWLSEPRRRMRLLAALVDGTQGHVGGDLAGRVWAASKVGDPLACSYATRILHQMCVPLFGMIRRWVFEGVLEDPACEFFVVCNTAAAAAAAAISSNGDQQRPGLTDSLASRDLWREAYRLEAAKLPPFISSELAATILRAGKSINFLRDACEDTQWVQEWAPTAAGTVAELGYGQLAVLEQVVLGASHAVDARLMAVLHSTGEFDRHCRAIRRYLLLGQGDFAVALLDCLGQELSKPAAEVSEVTVNHLLRAALLASAGGARADEEGGAQERLRASKTRSAGAGETGWDVICLHYQLGPPLNSVFTAAAQSCYSRLSRLLWLLRRTERSLGIAWHTLQVEIERCSAHFAKDACFGQLQALLRACMLLRAEMAHFTTNLQYYINLEVLECGWSEFMSAAAAAPDLDCLIAAHEKFLSVVLDRALLGPGRAEQLRATLDQLLVNCMGLAPLVSRFNEKFLMFGLLHGRLADALFRAMVVQVQLGLREMEHKAAMAAANTAAGRWGITGGSAVPAISLEDLGLLTDTLTKLAGRHRQLVAAFLEELPAAANQVNAEVRFLLARLDFSDFYTKGQQSQQATTAVGSSYL